MSQTTNLAVPLAAAAGAYFLAKAADHRYAQTRQQQVLRK